MFGETFPNLSSLNGSWTSYPNRYHWVTQTTHYIYLYMYMIYGLLNA